MQPNRRRVHSAEFKAAVLAECQRSGASVAAVAMSHGLNVNLVRKWLVGRGLKRDGLQAPRGVRPQPSMSTPGALPADGSPTMAQFIALPLPAATPVAATQPTAPAAANIQLEIRRGAVVVNVAWPMTACDQCAAWLREVLR